MAIDDGMRAFYQVFVCLNAPQFQKGAPTEDFRKKYHLKIRFIFSQAY
jgi:hypothetical protein